jgi:hypothetical protein
MPSQEAPEQPEDEQPSAFDYEATDFSTWSKGWHEKVYKDDSVNPDITLGELLLMYFEWMSVHQVTAFILLQSALVHATGNN